VSVLLGSVSMFVLLLSVFCSSLLPEQAVNASKEIIAINTTMDLLNFIIKILSSWIIYSVNIKIVEYTFHNKQLLVNTKVKRSFCRLLHICSILLHIAYNDHRCVFYIHSHMPHK